LINNELFKTEFTVKNEKTYKLLDELIGENVEYKQEIYNIIKDISKKNKYNIDTQSLKLKHNIEL
jgi:hypothetical protein